MPLLLSASHRPVVQALFRLALGLAVIAALLTALGPRQIADYVQHADFSMVGLAVALYTGSYLLRGLRWHALLVRVGLRQGWLETAAVSTLGWSLNALLPFKLGELVRLYLMQEIGRLPLLALLSSAVAERLLDIIVLLALLGLGLLLAGGPGIVEVPGALPWVLGLGLGVMLAAYLLAGRRWLAKKAAGPLGRLFQKAVDEYGRSVQAYARPSTLLIVFGLSLAAWTLQGMQYATFFLAFGLPITPAAFAAGFAAFMLSFAVNVVPGQVGTYELFFLAAFSAAGIASPDALVAVAIAAHAFNTLLLSGLGFLCYLKLGQPVHSLRQAWNQRLRARLVS